MTGRPWGVRPEAPEYRDHRPRRGYRGMPPLWLTQRWQAEFDRWVEEQGQYEYEVATDRRIDAAGKAWLTRTKNAHRKGRAA